MTPLRKPVRRVTVGECASVRRRLCVCFEPGDVLAIREQGRRRWVRAPLGKVYLTVARWNVEAERVAKKEARKDARTCTP